MKNSPLPKLLALLLLPCAPLACMGTIASPDVDQEAIGEAEDALSTITLSFSCNEPSWPRICTWSIPAGDGSASDHRNHSPFTWTYAQAGSPAYLATRTMSQETCGIQASVHDSAHTSDPTPSSPYNAIDVRSFAVPNVSTPVNQSAGVSVPAPHAGQHCDQLGSHRIQLLYLGSWIDVPGTINNPVIPASGTPGTETYRVKCDHPKGTHYSSPFTVTWTSPPAAPTCAVSCVDNGYPSYRCTTTASGGSGPYTYYHRSNGGAWYQDTDNLTSWVCKWKIPGYSYTAELKVVDSAGQECAPASWSCGMEEM